MTVLTTDTQLQLFPTRANRMESFSLLCNALGVKSGPNWHDRFGVAVRKWATNTIGNPIRTLSLFSGAGGLDIAFHDAGFQIGQMVEIEKRFAASLKANCGDGKYLGCAEVFCGDIRDFHPPSTHNVDFIVGGPPCQSFSAAGRRAAGVQGTDDARGTLFEEYVRLLKQLKPKAFLFENVYGIVGAQGGKAWQEIQDAFEGAGYHVHFRILDAADYGVPQHRERMFIVGTMGQVFKFPCPTHGPDAPDGRLYVNAAEAIQDAIVSDAEYTARVKGRFGHLLDEIPPGLNYSFFTERMGHPKPIFAWRSKFSDFLYKADPSTPTRTLKAQGGQYTGPFHWDNRPFSVSELKRLQTFPDSYEIVGARQVTIHQIGNSVAPQLARILALAILNQVFGIPLPAKLPLLERGEVLGFRKRKRGLTAIYHAKAKNALITANTPVARKSLRSRKYTALLTPEFDLQIKTNGSAPLRIEFTKSPSKWRIDVLPAKPAEEHGFTLSITHAPGASWGLNVPLVQLSGRIEDEVFTAAWKAFEAELIRFQFKADLVQLCGYYQYKPSLNCGMLFNDGRTPKKWLALRQIVEGEGVTQILPYTEVAKLWGIESSSVLDFAVWLRKLGYEVRNQNTNPQIPPHCLLVPYVFPTLNPQSVQLRKSLLGGE